MRVRIGPILPPAIAPIGFKDIGRGLLAMLAARSATDALADQLKGYFNARYCYLLSSGKASLALILRALKELHPERDEVLIPAFTCYSVPAAIFRVGLKIRICDVEPATLDFDYGELARQLSSPRLLCVIPTHLFGVTADIPRVRQLIGGREIAIVEDAAQAMGGERQGWKAGTMGDVGFFSLERGKAFSTVKGGIILTGSETIGRALQKQMDATPAAGFTEQLALAVYAMTIALFSRPWLYWLPKSLPFLGLGETIFAPDFPIKRLSEFQAGLAEGWQERLQENMRLRVKNSAFLGDLGIKAACQPEATASGLIRYPVFAADKGEKEALLRKSDHLGLGAADVYPGTVEDITGAQEILIGGKSAKARSIVEKMFTLPVHPSVTKAHLDEIVGLIRQSKKRDGAVLDDAEWRRQES